MLDEKDLNILRMLEDNARLTSKALAKKLRIPLTTVHNRIKRLEREGIIKGYTLVLDYKKLGRPISAYVLISVKYERGETSQEKIAKELKGNYEVEEVNIITGESDILIKVRVKDIDELNDLIIKKLRNIQGVDTTKTMIVLSSV